MISFYVFSVGVLNSGLTQSGHRETLGGLRDVASRARLSNAYLFSNELQIRVDRGSSIPPVGEHCFGRFTRSKSKIRLLNPAVLEKPP